MVSTPKATSLTLFMIILLDAMGFGIIFPVLGPLFTSPDQGLLSANTSILLRDLLYGATIGIFALFMLFGTPIFGDLSDSYGRKKILFICLAGTAFGATLCAFGILLKSILLLLIGRAINGFVAGSQAIAQAAIIDVSTENSKTKNLSHIVLAGSLGFIVGPMLGGYVSDNTIVSWFHFSTPFYLYSLFALLNAIFLLLVFKDVYTPHLKRKLDLMKGLQILLEALKHPKLRLLIVVLLLSELAWATYFQYEALFLNEVLHYNPRQIGNFISYVALVFVITMLVIIRIFLKFFREREIILASFVICGLGFLLITFRDTHAAHLIAAWPIAAGVGMSYTALLTCCSQAVEKERQGFAMGVSSAAVAASWIAGALLTGTLGAVFRTFPFLVAALLMFLSAMMFLRFRN